MVYGVWIESLLSGRQQRCGPLLPAPPGNCNRMVELVGIEYNIFKFEAIISI